VGMLRIMSHRGDDRIMWDHTAVEVGERAADAAVAEAERIFAEQRVRGATAFKMEHGKPTQIIDAFDRTAEQIVIVPRVVGG
jgi:hypothetical protein